MEMKFFGKTFLSQKYLDKNIEIIKDVMLGVSELNNSIKFLKRKMYQFFETSQNEIRTIHLRQMK